MQPVLGIAHRSGPGGVRVVAVSGDADMDTTDPLRTALRTAVGARPVPAAVVVDCSGLEFCAAAGLNELLRAREAALAAGIAFRLAAPRRQMRQLLRLTGADRVFAVDRNCPAVTSAESGRAGHGMPRTNGRPHPLGDPGTGVPSAADPVRRP
ncbi:STAS domain-containing protein [Kitasatospora sp. DSM 101779]|uniref:STAS domain-containing protein n=1 Tax=Kitasatospora sp. DSM 101779 TaxID=2853165 RepID=UPI0021DB66A8|nr:STAS domain-containing protein [Kitasatospora sp. DSM 101779]MCU7826837.1 STAS domain-containing protein [Kitasatospora sp. DSM 101779]